MQSARLRPGITPENQQPMSRQAFSLAATGIAIAAALTLFSGCAGGPSTRQENAPAVPAPAPSAAVKAQLAPTGTLRVAVFTGNPLIGNRNETTGEITGTTVTLGKALAERAGVPVAIVEYASIARLVDAASANSWDIAVLGVDASRRDVLDYAPAHFSVDITYLVAPGANIQSVADADRPGVRIAAARAGVAAIVLSRALHKATFVQTETEAAAFEALKTGRAQALAQNRSLLMEFAGRLPGSRVLDDRLLAAELAIALPKKRGAALAYVSEFVKQAKASGLVKRAIDDAGLRGVNVAPAGR
jgi:polar amino acid transport system substrate-binding protein